MTGRRVAAVLAGVAFAVGYVLLSGALLVRGTLLDDAVYTGALARADVYDRLYTEVLTDPELADTTEQIVGRLHLQGVDPAEARTLTSNALRWAVPPSLARTGSEAVITGTLAYLRGDSDQIAATVDVGVVVERVQKTVVDHARTAMAMVATREVRSIEEYRTAVGELVASVSAGRIPGTLPVPAADLDRQQVVDVVADLAIRSGADPLTVRSLADAGSDQGALIVAVTETLTKKAETARQELESKLDEGRGFDAIERLTQRQEDTQTQVVANPRRLAFLLAGSLVAGGALTLLAWWSITRTVGPPLAAGTGTGPGTWNLPSGLRWHRRWWPGSRRRPSIATTAATGMWSCATGATTRWPTPRPTTRCRAPTWSGSGPNRTRPFVSSSTAASAHCSSTPTTGPRPCPPTRSRTSALTSLRRSWPR